MNILVFGASGACGSQVVRLAIERRHSVTAVVRPETNYTPPPGTAIRTGDVLSAGFVSSVIPGHQVVVSCLGMRYAHPWARRRSPDDFTSCATKNIILGMEAAGIRRITVVSAAGIGDSRLTLNWPMRVLLATSNVGVAYADLERVEAELRESALDWQAVRPTTLTNGPRTGTIRRVDRYSPMARISREDVAMFLVQQVEAEAFSFRTPMIAAGGA